jgi:hypothetical protein
LTNNFFDSKIYKLNKDTTMEVISLNPKESKKKEKAKEELLEMLDTVRGLAANGELEEFVMAWCGPEGEVQITVNIKDMIGGIGLFEVGKHILITQAQ